jgi:hypothetical protein
MSTKLDALIDKENAAKATAAGAAAAGDAAKAEVARLEETLASLRAVRAQHDDLIAQANAAFKATKDAATAFATSTALTGASPTLPGGLTGADLDTEAAKDLLAPPDPAKKKLADYATSVASATTDAAAAAADAVAKRLAVDTAKAAIDAQVPALGDAAGRAQGWLTDARAAAFRATGEKKTDAGAAYWDVQKAKGLLAKFTTPGDAPLKDAITELEKRYDAYADAVDASITAEGTLRAKLAAVDAAVAQLEAADAQVVTALQKLVKSVL